MAELRWILLVAGLLFLLALAGWEVNRARRSRRIAQLEAERGIDAVLASSARNADEPEEVAAAPELPARDAASAPAADSDADERADAHRIAADSAPGSAARIEPTLDEATLPEPLTAVDPSAPIEASPPLRVEW